MFTGLLHPYQPRAVDQFLARGKTLVAYEMGLGKTPIAIAAAEELLGCKDITTALLVVPAALIYQWAQALAQFTDLPTRTIQLKRQPIVVPAEPGLVIVDGPPKKRWRQLAKCSAFGENRTPDYVIMSYDTVVSDTRKVRRIRAGMVVLDEATAIKNFGAERTLTIKRALTPPYRLALTGTPVENRPEDAYSIMEWADPGVLGPFDLFEKTYIERYSNGTVARYKNLPVLHAKLSTAMVRARRSDPDVKPFLPDVDHATWHVDLDPTNQAMYDLMAKDLLEELSSLRNIGSFDLGAYYSGADMNAFGLGKAMAVQQAIEMFLDHPALLRDRDTDYIRRLGQIYVTSTPKLDYLAERVGEILEFPGNKVLIFTRWLGMLSLIGQRLPLRCLLYQGEMTPSQKTGVVAQFAASDGPRVLISSHAGAYGTDMRMVSHLINYDLPWSGGMRSQINGRHQRASSEFAKVYIRDLIVRGTIEERKLSMLEYKQSIAAAVADGKMPRSGRIENDLVGLADFLANC